MSWLMIQKVTITNDKSMTWFKKNIFLRFMCTNKNYIMQKVCTMSPALQMQQAHINDEFF